MSKDKDLSVTTVRFMPNGADHELQQLITQLLHNIVLEDGRVTLGELGYLHQNTLMLNQDTQSCELNIYFDARFAYRKVKNPMTDAEELVIVDEMNMFRNWLFVGDAQKVFTIERVLAPKTEIVEDEIGRARLKFKKGNKQVETAAAVMHCNIFTTVAAALDINLMDSNFRVQVNPVARGANSAVDSIVISASSRVVPAALTVTHSARMSSNPGTCYDPEFAVPYLMELADRIDKSSRNRADMIQRVKKEGKKNKQKTKNKIHKGFSKWA